MTPSLMSMPLEILLCICSYLPATDYGLLRRASKHLDSSLFSAFAKRFFHSRQFMLTESSLRVLVAISKSRLSSFLKELTLGTNRFDPSLSPCLRRRLNHVQQARYLAESIDQDTLVNTGHDRVLLCEALQELAVETIRIKDCDPGSSYGATTILNETGAGGVYTHGDAFFNTACLNKLLCALDNAKSRPNKLEFVFRNGILDSAFHIPSYMNGVKAVLAGVQELSLRINSCVSPADAALIIRNAQPPEADTHLLRRFVGCLSNLRKLSVVPRFRENVFGPDDFMQWLGAPLTAKVEPDAPTPATFPHLQELHLNDSTLCSEVLLGLITKFKPTLHTLNLEFVIISDFPHRHAKDLDLPMPNLWSSFLRNLAKSGVQLQSFTVCGAEQYTCSGPGNIIFEEEKKPENMYKAQTITFKGLDTMDKVKNLASRAFVHVLEDSDEELADEWDDDIFFDLDDTFDAFPGLDADDFDPFLF
ncbi:uncharacterized protein BCR38DRAFT_489047 [Pseudomassariella vexata]|uniref:F-box domain-containing protein n=1 Tax=Pseudomassariella vexata TaxID=1141098 RepID=A0A1Y2DKN7_9PEZI|nr:uncharacterized protein BCR38DRAFT_489047 [Pseudomassariella vexata]ORY59315.1 hypothetical protein BCR38DRAFT_489047 [Pseudomassariella vexata]